MARKKQVLNNIDVIDIADKGHAIGKTPEGEIVILLGGCVPGDKINMRVHRKKKGLKHGYVTEVISKSKNRTTPFCEYFGTCGGCKWQSLDYAVQAALKEKAVKSTISRIAKDDDNKVQPIIAADKIQRYRNKLEYTFSTKRWLTLEEINSEKDFDDRNGLGFHISGAFDKVLDIQQCYLQDELSDKLRNRLRELAEEKGWPFYDIRNNHGFLRNIMIRNATTDQWMVTFIFGRDDQDMISEVTSEMITSFPEVTSWHYIVNAKANSSFNDLPSVHVSGATHIMETLGDISYRISPKSFFQTNSYQAKQLYDAALSLAKIGPQDIVYDLYTGTGSIALYRANSCKQVVGIEVIQEAIDDAKINAETNKIDNATFLVGDVKDVLDPDFAINYGEADVVITDPPRAGMHKDVVDTLLTLAPQRIVYISCNPSTQARDILLLKEKYELKEVIPCDMFPHTSHIESIASLELKG